MSDTSDRRLAGWKEIANYLNTSVRTAQRWEQQLGLPVHHLGSSRGYSVIAYVGELDTWLQGRQGSAILTVEQPEPETASAAKRETWRRHSRLIVIAVMAVVAVGSTLAILRFVASRPPKVSSITFSGQQILAWSNGKLVWSYDFGQPARNPPPEEVARRLHIFPSGELIVSAPLLQRETGISTDAVYRFSASGRVLWRHVFADRVRFGGEECGAPWEARDLMVSGDGANTSAWCTICSYLKSVAILVKFDSSGNATNWFVNYGHLGRLRELHVRGGPYLLAGGINNETNEGTLVVLDETRPCGHSPQTGALAECEPCPEGQPYRYFLFPRSEVIRVVGPPYNGVVEIVVANDRIQVMTTEGLERSAGLWALYHISEALVPQSVFFSDYYWFEHEKLSAEGRIDHAPAACPERLRPITVREWSPSEGWKDIMLPPVQSRIPK